jgi:uncharacterized protein YdhG (YjbR/CyaY superfamily)
MKRTTTAKPDEGFEAYLAALPKDKRDALARLRRVIRSAAPGATEVISYAIPAFKYNGRSLVSMAAWKDHCSLYVQSYAALREFASEIKPYRTEKGTLSFRLDAPLPDALVRKLVRARVAEVDKATAKASRE